MVLSKTFSIILIKRIYVFKVKKVLVGKLLIISVLQEVPLKGQVTIRINSKAWWVFDYFVISKKFLKNNKIIKV